METVTVRASKTYSILMKSDLLIECGVLCRQVISGERVLLLSDSNVMPLYGERVRNALESAGFQVVPYIIPAGETSKSPENLVHIVSFLAERQFTRKDAVIALGGGVVGDLGGFCAATYLRGIGFVQIPTTLLACVDSSVGGKTAVNLPVGKNLFGAFYQPDLVLCDPKTLSTLPPDVYADGMAEVVKYGMIYDQAFFSALEARTLDEIGIIRRCVEIKSEIVGKDETERGLRRILNFGHTVGHAVEQCSGFTVSHGSAVAIGMATVTRALVKLQNLDANISRRLETVLRSFHLPVSCAYDAETLCAAALSDKKRMDDRICLVGIKRIGESMVYDLPIDALHEYLQAGLVP